MRKEFYVYILASKRNGTIYIRATSDIIKRIYEHHHIEESAITREKRLKKWRRQWKIMLIEEKNPNWKDLYSEIIGSRVKHGMTESSTEQ